MKFTEIQISGLREGKHSFRFELGPGFSAGFSSEFFADPQLLADVSLDYTETMIKADILISGSIELTCDLSLETFRRDVEEKVVHFYKFGEEEQELSDELEVISSERVFLDFDQLIYDTVALSVPQKKVHPQFGTDEEGFPQDSDGRLIYSSVTDPENDQTERDTRWDILKNLN